ncbi:Metal-dependent hydrolase, beta-lactamase superfamily II [Butyrivibrio sp. ob235]|uniref:MBL fold metallo-hydrolase n=1 Tax=Butyrivibrio sp. ob235 TaxID=1761780 RepID=UPI0008C9BBEA|nr:MBL fold metallo-hydrolase [Butyrivibrio sp. ob235]SEL97101.1 Metal-dependent hydrolase, beta-lactamase superfamily II [Butyrivibrio sp. ob235]
MLEIIVFGKGYGEAILVRVNEKWIVIDSFIEHKSMQPIALKYFSDKGYDIEDIVGVICSHWDTDHVKGISEIIEQHSDGLSVCLPIAYNDTRFTEYVLFNADETIGITSEFLKVLRLIKKKSGNRVYAISDRNLFQKEIGDPEVCLKALSPNDNQYTKFLDSISIPTKGQRKTHISLEENKISIVAYIKTCIDAILLGGDMENSQDGWESICDNFNDAKCHVFKIPHHGSQNGYNGSVWGRIVDRPISIITRYNPSNLPTDEMVEKIAKESSSVYVVGSRPKKDRSTINIVKKYGDHGTIKTMSMLDADYGYVRIYKKTKDEPWDIETYGAVEIH